MNRIFCCFDPVLTDAFIARSMGYDPWEIKYIELAEKMGVGSADVDNAEIIELNKDESKVMPSSSRIVNELACFVEEKDACSACYANLIQALMRLKDSGELRKFKDNPISIGQGYRRIFSSSPGIGSCTSGFASHVQGCPAKARDILEYLRRF